MFLIKALIISNCSKINVIFTFYLVEEIIKECEILNKPIKIKTRIYMPAMMKKYGVLLLLMFITYIYSFGSENKTAIAERNLIRAMESVDNTISAHFTGDDMKMARFYNPYTNKRSDEPGSVWMYTSGIEAVNAVLHALKTHKQVVNDKMYKKYYDKYKRLLYDLYDNADYYLGTFTLTSYTRTNEWTVYGVNRGSKKGNAKVAGIENVYDDQMWLVRELLESYKITGDKVFLEKAEYLTEYVLDGWDCTIDESGNERGGITWGPGYVSKHSCSNGPMVSPLVWLHEIYKDKDVTITHYFIDKSDKVTRKQSQMKKSDYYLMFAKKVYDWQKEYLIREDGVYADMMGGCTPRNPEIELVNGVEYRKGILCRDKVGPAISYNSGTMLSGAADLYHATGEGIYKDDAVSLSDASFVYFAKKDEEVSGYYSYKINGFNNWFNGVLMRGYADCYPFYINTGGYARTFQQNLDFAYNKFRYKGLFPTNLLLGWNKNREENNLEGMFSFSFAAEYAVLSRLMLNDKMNTK